MIEQFQSFLQVTGGDVGAAATLVLAATIANQSQPAAEMLTIGEAARVLGLSPSGLRKLVARRAIQFSQPAKHGPIRFRREWLNEYIDRGSVDTGAPAKQERRKKPKPFSGSGFADPSLFDV